MTPPATPTPTPTAASAAAGAANAPRRSPEPGAEPGADAADRSPEPGGESAAAPRGPTPLMETVLEAAARFRTEGYDGDFAAVADGRLRCEACRTDHDPADMVVEHVVRYEGASDPDDETILLAVRCRCGQAGLYVTAFGPNASPADAAALRQLP